MVSAYLLFKYDSDQQGEESPALRRSYEGVQRDGEVIRVRDTVLLRSGPRKKSLPYVAKVSAFWEDPESGRILFGIIIYCLRRIWCHINFSAYFGFWRFHSRA